MIRIVLVDDHAVVRSGLRLLLDAQDDMEVVGEAGNAKDAVFRARALKPDVILLDVVMPGESGIEVLPQLLKESPETKVLVLSMQDDPSYVREAFAAGASGYVLKEAADEEVVSAVREIAGGGHYVHPTLGARMVAAEAQERAAAEADPSPSVNVRCYACLALGHTNQEIAQELYISVRTAESHRAHIMQKLRLATRAELVRYALSQRTAGGGRLLDAEPDPELARLARPVEALVSETRRPLDELLPRLEGRRDHRVVDDVVDDPFDLGRLEEEDHLGRGEIRAVAVEAELFGVERRAPGHEGLCLLVRALAQTGDDHQAVHRCLLRLAFSKG